MKPITRISNVCRSLVSAFLLTVTLAGCAKNIDLTLKSISVENETDVAITVKSDEDILNFARQHSIAPVGMLHICGSTDYSSVQYLELDERIRSAKSQYQFIFDRSLSKQTYLISGSGKVLRGWPSDLVQKKGICFSIQGGAMGYLIYSDKIKLPDINTYFYE